MTGPASVHKAVLLNEVLKLTVDEKSPALHKNRGETVVDRHSKLFWYLDGTLGGAGHATAIARAYGGRIGIIGLDLDPEALARDRAILEPLTEKLILENVSFRELDTVLAENRLSGVDLILLDLGYSSDQLENSGRGFSFQRDEPLIMTLGSREKYSFTAADILNRWNEEVIADIIFGYGEERYARRIARAIVHYRQKKLFETTGELVEVIRLAVPAAYRRSKINPATKTFQALRIAVNDELNALKEGLAKGYAGLNEGGKMAVISFHSLEDRIVKEFFRAKNGEGAKILTKRPITASPEEIATNPRSRSAKLRVIQKSLISLSYQY